MTIPPSPPPEPRPQPWGAVNPMVAGGVLLGTILVALVAAGLVSRSAPPPGTPTTINGDGQFVVGTDIAPGTYRTAGVAQGKLTCFWERQKDLLGTGDSILANASGQGPATVTIPNSDAAFKTTGCQPWTRTD